MILYFFLVHNPTCLARIVLVKKEMGVAGGSRGQGVTMGTRSVLVATLTRCMGDGVCRRGHKSSVLWDVEKRGTRRAL